VSLARLNRFVLYARDRRILEQDDLLTAIRQMSAFDRRIGCLAAFRGYFQPEQINTVLLEQSRTGGMFGECATRLNLLTSPQIAALLRIQKDDLFLFTQAVVAKQIMTADKMVVHLKAFLDSQSETSNQDLRAPTEEKRMLDKQVREILRNIEAISPLPATAQRAIAMLDDPRADLDKVGRVVSLDPGLTSTLLRVANSAFYGMRDRVTSMSKAVVVLGTKKMRHLVIAAAIMQKFQSIPPAFTRTFWEASLRAGQWCKEIAVLRGMAEPDDLFICGLLHDIGRLVTMQYFRPIQTRLDELRAAGKPPIEAEKSVMGGTHADIGGFMFNLWQMPRATVQSAMFHHHDLRLVLTSPNMDESVPIVHMASAIIDMDPNLDALAHSDVLESIGRLYAPPLNLGTDLNMDRLSDRVESNLGNLVGTLMVG